MGNLCSAGLQQSVPLTGTFEAGEPTDDEQETWKVVDELLQSAAETQTQVEEYKGCQELARQAMSNPSHETELAAFEGLLSAVDAIQCFYLFSQKLETVFPTLLKKLADGGRVDPHTLGFEEHPALVNQLCQILSFSLNFDQTRMLRPNLSNDFSYYRRLLPKFNKHDKISVKDEDASAMALFTAQHIPMLHTLTKSGTNAHEDNPEVSKVFSILANSCYSALKAKTIEGEEKQLLCARAMTGATLLYDHVEYAGAYGRKSPVGAKQIIVLLKKDFPNEHGLMNAIRYSSRTFENAPQSLQDLFD